MRLNLLTAAALLLVWAACVFGPVLLLAVLVFAGTLVFQKRWTHFAILAGLSPAAAAVVLAIASYRMGSARLLVTGLPSLETYNVDPETRLPPQQ